MEIISEENNITFYLLLNPKSVFLPIKNTIATTTSPITPKDIYGDKPKEVGISPNNIDTTAIKIAYGNCVLT